MRLESNWFEYVCPECDLSWESTQDNPDREWCMCGTVEIPFGPYSQDRK